MHDGGRPLQRPPTIETDRRSRPISVERSLADPVPLGKDPEEETHGLPTAEGAERMTTPLSDQFKSAQHYINLNARRRVAIAAHLEVRAVLLASSVLASHGLEHVLIDSYPRDVTIWPGKDVDIFGKLTVDSIDSISPGDAYDLFLGVLNTAFAGRITPQPRSIKIDYRGGRLPETSFIKQAAEVLREKVDTPGQPFDFVARQLDAIPFS